jgi:hypothetical protein
LLTVRDDYKQWKIASFAPLFGGVDNPLAQDMADADGVSQGRSCEPTRVTREPMPFCLAS